jgi:hypothetical protein
MVESSTLLGTRVGQRSWLLLPSQLERWYALRTSWWPATTRMSTISAVNSKKRCPDARLVCTYKMRSGCIVSNLYLGCNVGSPPTPPQEDMVIIPRKLKRKVPTRLLARRKNWKECRNGLLRSIGLVGRNGGTEIYHWGV